MKERLLEFLRQENKSSAQFADEIGVQASGISHILSGRNNPSLDFVLKMLEKYKFLSSDWLLFGKGSMYKEPKMQSLFDNIPPMDKEPEEKIIKNVPDKNEPEPRDNTGISAIHESRNLQKNREEKIVKIVWFYEDNSFDEFYPR